MRPTGSRCFRDAEDISHAAFAAGGVEGGGGECLLHPGCCRYVAWASVRVLTLSAVSRPRVLASIYPLLSLSLSLPPRFFVSAEFRGGRGEESLHSPQFPLLPWPPPIIQRILAGDQPVPLSRRHLDDQDDLLGEIDQGSGLLLALSESQRRQLRNPDAQLLQPTSPSSSLLHSELLHD
jgi:hypothetical protein